MYNILENVDKHHFPQFFFSNLVGNCGTRAFATILEMNGWINADDILASVNGSVEGYFDIVNGYRVEDNKRIFVLFDNDSKAKRSSYLKIINSVENVEGKYCHFIIGSQAISEGLTLKCIQALHILDPPWNYSRYQQIVGRAIRNKSHLLCGEDRKKVCIYNYASFPVKDSGYPSIDKLKYDLCFRKYEANDKCLYILKQLGQIFHEDPKKKISCDPEVLSFGSDVVGKGKEKSKVKEKKSRKAVDIVVSLDKQERKSYTKAKDVFAVSDDILVYGIVVGDVLKLVDKRRERKSLSFDSVGVRDTRLVFKGKAATSFRKTELVDILVYLGSEDMIIKGDTIRDIIKKIKEELGKQKFLFKENGEVFKVL